MAIAHTSACADPRAEGSAAFEQQLLDDIRLRQPRFRSGTFQISGYATLLCPSVNTPHLRQYAVDLATET